MRIFSLVFVFISWSNLYSIDLGIYDWVDKRSQSKLSEADKALNEIMIKQHHQFDYYLENDVFKMNWAFHRIIYVNSNEAIQRHNRISIPLNTGAELLELKARVINKDGTIINFDKSNLKELNNEETGKASRIFAIEGIEVGSEIEYFYVRKLSGQIYQRIYLQTDVKALESTALITCPGHLKFDLKAYNGEVSIERNEQSDQESRNSYKITALSIPELKEESYSYYESSLRKVEFKLAYNTAKSGARMYTWDDAAKTFYKLLYTIDKDDEKTLAKIIKGLNDNPNNSVADRIYNVEDKLKLEYKIDPSVRGIKIPEVLKYKITSSEALTKILLAVYNRLGIECVPLISTSREKTRFDGGFDTWAYLDDYLIFFPKTNSYLAPFDQEYRYPLIPHEYTDQDALFIEPITVGSITSALASVKKVPQVDYKTSFDNLDIVVDFDSNLLSNKVKMVRKFSGYDGMFVIPYFNLMSDDQKKTMVDEITKQTAPDASFNKWDIKIQKSDISCNIDVDFTTSHFVEKAGNRILFKVGLLIGPQVEMYREDDRKNPIENDFNRAYNRVIKINIPQGYIVKNLDDINKGVYFDESSDTPFLFKSSYTVEGNVLVIKLEEYYKVLRVELDHYEDFRKVVNAAADFNKVTLVLEKEKK